MRKSKTVILLGILATTTLLSACQSEEEKQVALAKDDFKILYTFQEDKIRPVVEKEKTAEELAEEYLLNSIGLEDEDPTFSERGVLKDQGIFVESAIHDGSKIPNISALTQEDIDSLNSDSGDAFEKEKAEEYDQLKAQRQKVLEAQYAEDNTEKTRIEEEIERQVAEQEQNNKGAVEEEEDKNADFELEDPTIQEEATE